MSSFKFPIALLITLCLTIVSVAQEDDEKKKVDPKVKAIKQMTNQMMRKFAKAELTEEQKEKAVAVIEEHIGGVLEARTAMNGLLTREQRQARTAAVKAAKAEGIKNRKKHRPLPWKP
jgi:uncharacterized MAPEG superfamily protein